MIPVVAIRAQTLICCRSPWPPRRSLAARRSPEPQRDMRGGRERPIGGFELWPGFFMRSAAWCCRPWPWATPRSCTCPAAGDRLRVRRSAGTARSAHLGLDVVTLALIHGINGLRNITLDYVRKPGMRFALNMAYWCWASRCRPATVIVVTSDPTRGGRSPDGHFTTYDALAGAGGAGMRAAIEPSDKVRTAVVPSSTSPVRTPSRARGGAALGNVEEDSSEWHVRHRHGRRLPHHQPAAQLMTERPSRRSTNSNAGTVQPHAGRVIDQWRSAGTPRTTQRPVKRACYGPTAPPRSCRRSISSGETRRALLQRVLLSDLLRDADGATAGIVAHEPPRASPRVPCQERRDTPAATGACSASPERPCTHRRRSRGGMASRRAARGHGDVPVPPTGLAARCAVRRREVRAASCSTRTASGSWSGMAPRSRPALATW